VSWKLLLVLPRPRPRAAAAGHNSSTASLTLYAPLEPATGLLHGPFVRRPAVIMLAGGTTPLHALRSRWLPSVSGEFCWTHSLVPALPSGAMSILTWCSRVRVFVPRARAW
jgi:hypothetical protein